MTQNLPQPIIVNERKQPPMFRMFLPQVLCRNIPFSMLFCGYLQVSRQAIFRPLKRMNPTICHSIRRRTRGPVGRCRKPRFTRRGRRCGPDNSSRKTLAFFEEPFETAFEAWEAFESARLEDEDGEERDETDERFDGKSFFARASPVDRVVVESVTFVPERNAIASLRIEGQSISDEKEMLKEL